MTYQTMDVRPIGGALGAEIYGANLTDRNASPMWSELRRAFLEYHVIAVRGQNLSPADIMHIGEKFGGPCYYPFARGMEGYPYVTEVIKEKHDRQNFGESWHTDTMYLDKPAGVTLLYALETPPKGGDTMYANTAAAYDALSDGMKKMLAGLIGVSSAGLRFRKGGSRVAHHATLTTMAVQNAEKSESYESRHPVVRTHPETGRKSLYVSANHTVRFDGFTEEESRPLIVWLDKHATSPEFTCRVRWEPGQLTVWDNRTTMHSAVNDYHGYRRHMRRLAAGPETPV